MSDKITGGPGRDRPEIEITPEMIKRAKRTMELWLEPHETVSDSFILRLLQNALGQKEEDDS